MSCPYQLRNLLSTGYGAWETSWNFEITPGAVHKRKTRALLEVIRNQDVVTGTVPVVREQVAALETIYRWSTGTSAPAQENANGLSASVVTIFCVVWSGIRDTGTGMDITQDPGSRINIPDPQHWAYWPTYFWYKNYGMLCSTGSLGNTSSPWKSLTYQLLRIFFLIHASDTDLADSGTDAAWDINHDKRRKRKGGKNRTRNRS